MNFILLDIDGVLTTNAYSQRCRHEHRQSDLLGRDWLNPDCVSALRRIIDATGAKVVIYTSRKGHGIEELRQCWEINQLPGEITFATHDSTTASKKDAILDWIRVHPNDKYVILSSESLDLNRLVMCTSEIGLTRKETNMAINMMKLPIIQTSEKLKKIMSRILDSD